MWAAAEDRLPSRAALAAAMRQRYGAALYECLQKGCVAVAGLGGLGSHIAVMLARCGVGRLQLVDFDRVELSNIQRQAYQLSDIGSYKAAALQAILYRINPYIDVHINIERVTPANLTSLFRSAAIVCEAFDDPAAKAMLVNGLLTELPAVKIVAASGLAGFGNCNAIVTRQVLPNLYICGDNVSAVKAGVPLLPPRVMVCAGHQADKVIELLSAAD